ncbi:MAG: hypothetical protein QF367_07235 [Acidimicrobiales bacterium]|nr:hypothetical protein [Actinomycetes bacterium]MDP6106310.1 hypothetical protein [Acidimicrobiales bacterium]MDP6240076.1 hypothetical protein [Acidimicrobiales bacterium]MDP7125037.1 hypothetical protein [Acidimicrobiales bacterium]MDP7351336.1 hypothetical protein [Acidimicrobiales bacterium]
MRSLITVPLLSVALLASACASDGTATEDGDDTVTTTTGTATTLPEVRPTVAEEEPPTWYGEMVNLHDLTAGQCFNRYSWFQADRHIEFDTVVPCELPHKAEIYLHVQHPARQGAPWPGDGEMESFARSQCYEAFDEFVGLIYELSELEIAFLVPNRTDFEHDVAQFRGVHCYVVHAEGEDLINTARGSLR